jgi:hypothetical protein
MFSCCEKGPAANGNPCLDLQESAETLTILLRLLHTPPPPPVLLPRPKNQEKFMTQIRVREYEPNSVIPLPMLPVFFTLADKYLLTDSIVSSLHSHLLANASIHPLQVYGFASRHGLDSIANAASKYLLHPPLSSYAEEDIKVLPCAEAYHKLVKLHAFRIKSLRAILLAEDIFPHGYGECASHSHNTTALWERARQALVYRIEAGKLFKTLVVVFISFSYILFLEEWTLRLKCQL